MYSNAQVQDTLTRARAHLEAITPPRLAQDDWTLFLKSYLKLAQDYTASGNSIPARLGLGTEEAVALAERILELDTLPSVQVHLGLVASSFRLSL